MSNMIKTIRMGLSFLSLTLLVGITAFVALQNQDIRNKAGNEQEFIQLTPAKLLKNKKTMFRVVVNKLQQHLKYRLVFTVTYTENPDFPPPPGTNKPSERKKTIRIHDNKTYPFTLRLTSCYYVPHVTVTLFSRERGKKSKPVMLPDNTVTTSLVPPCKTTKVQPTEKPNPPPQPTSEQPSGETPTDAPQPTQDITPIETTNGEIPDDAGDTISDSDATDIETGEDIGILDTEIDDVVPTNTPAPANTSTPTIIPTTIPTSTINQIPTAIPTTTQLLAYTNPTPTTIPQFVSVTPSPTIESSMTVSSTPSQQTHTDIPTSGGMTGGTNPGVSFGKLAQIETQAPAVGTPTPTSIVPLALLTHYPTPTSGPLDFLQPPTRTKASQAAFDTTTYSSSPRRLSIWDVIQAITEAIRQFFIQLFMPLFEGKFF
jgi:hypothetical protein